MIFTVAELGGLAGEWRQREGRFERGIQRLCFSLNSGLTLERKARAKTAITNPVLPGSTIMARANVATLTAFE
jgi:hypothetical protein